MLRPRVYGRKPVPTPVKIFEVEPEAASLPPLRKELRSLFAGAGFNEKSINDLLLCVDEVLTNIIRHGYGKEVREKERIHLQFNDLDGKAEIVIEDRSPCFDVRKVPPPKFPCEKPGGLGVHLIRSLTDEIHYEALKPVGNRLRLVKYKKQEKKG